MPDDVLDPRRLRQFLAVAEHMNMSRAAAELHLTQQAVSSTIKTLERDLGVQLLHRSGRRISLTAAGAALHAGARPVIDAAAALARSTRQAAEGEREKLVIAHTPAISSEEVFDLTAGVRAAFPDASITARQCFPGELVAALREGTADVALRRGATTPEDVAAAVIAYTPLHVAVAAAHRLAAHTTLTMDQLAGERLIVWGPPGTSFYADYLLSVCRRAGFEPSVVVNHIQGTAPTTAVIGTDCFAFVTAEPGTYHHGQTVVRPIDHPPVAPVQALWLRHTESAVRQMFLGGPQASEDGPAAGDGEAGAGDVAAVVAGQ
ncbi:LysR family transcriptional regulator [Nocardia cyriacigeorgica]|uniref:LysR family transcriptional regulator n=1 Tax=Nocardia cyriacigeorgica TaxID=135487 RepID=UPI0018941656|nr:LysR family transcriptional regulator [Nocardia cyriacigeorgica]MBF6089918.1 LysR family transcriptional regulator [Nocardia cyriacigeorgica]MBF6101040.1 LysR family transcriptional regulator [Nocardia cyriacigeorgica]MBF6346935.1 LysR family transcriptional regulator [Nocardia cyriacigeorgica]